MISQDGRLRFADRRRRGDLAEILRAEHARREHAEAGGVSAAAVVEPVHLAARDEERVAGSDRVRDAFERERDRALEDRSRPSRPSPGDSAGPASGRPAARTSETCRGCRPCRACAQELQAETADLDGLGHRASASAASIRPLEAGSLGTRAASSIARRPHSPAAIRPAGPLRRPNAAASTPVKQSPAAVVSTASQRGGPPRCPDPAVR